MKSDLISRQDAIDALDCINGTEEVLRSLPPVQPKRPEQPEPFDDGYSGIYVKEEYVLKFYYVESEDDYWIGRRLDNFYYATWDRDLQNFVWSKSRYLPWGEHIVAPDTLWKEHTYPSEPKEIPLKDWLEGFYAKYFMPAEQPERTGKWIYHRPPDDWVMSLYTCDQCGHVEEGKPNFCPNCGADMRGKRNG